MMINGKVTAKFDQRKFYHLSKKRSNKAQALLNKQVLKDSNAIAPKDSGDLRASGKIEKKNNIVWDIRYAIYAWAFDDTINYTTPNTSGRWFEVAKLKRKKFWVKVFKKTYKRG